MCMLKWFKKATAIILGIAVTIGIICTHRQKEVKPVFDELTPYVKSEKKTDVFETGRYDIIVSKDGDVVNTAGTMSGGSSKAKHDNILRYCSMKNQLFN